MPCRCSAEYKSHLSMFSVCGWGDLFWLCVQIPRLFVALSRIRQLSLSTRAVWPCPPLCCAKGGGVSSGHHCVSVSPSARPPGLDVCVLSLYNTWATILLLCMCCWRWKTACMNAAAGDFPLFVCVCVCVCVRGLVLLSLWLMVQLGM